MNQYAMNIKQWIDAYYNYGIVGNGLLLFINFYLIPHLLLIFYKKRIKLIWKIILIIILISLCYLTGNFLNIILSISVSLIFLGIYSNQNIKSLKITEEKILDIKVSVTTYEIILQNITKNIKNNKKTFIVAINPEKILLSRKNKEVKNILNSATYKIPDGVGILLASKLKLGNIRNRITGIDLMEKICSLANKKHYKVFLYGAKEDTLLKLKDILKEKYSDLILCGYENGYVKNENKIIEKINKAKPDILFVALGSPKQEKFISNNIEKINCKIFQGVGGSFDVLCGNIKRAPKWMQRCGLEWLYRLFKQPKRILRYIKLFGFLVLIIFNISIKAKNNLNNAN